MECLGGGRFKPQQNPRSPYDVEVLVTFSFSLELWFVTSVDNLHGFRECFVVSWAEIVSEWVMVSAFVVILRFGFKNTTE